MCCSVTWPPHAAAKLARVCGEMLATKSFADGSSSPETVNLSPLLLLSRVICSCGAPSSTLSTSLWLCRLTSTASAVVTQPEHARQSVRDICAGSAPAAAVVVEDGCWPSRMTSNSRDSEVEEGCGCVGSVSTGLMQATPGEMKSLRSSAERMADIVGGCCGRRFAHPGVGDVNKIWELPVQTPLLGSPHGTGDFEGNVGPICVRGRVLRWGI